MRHRLFQTSLLIFAVCTLSVTSLAAASCEAHADRVLQATERATKAGACRADKIDKIEKLIKQRASSEDSEELETTRILFSTAFETCPVEALKLTLNAGLDGAMIGRMISALPMSFVDRPCAVEQRLNERIEKLSAAMRHMDDSRLEVAKVFIRHLASVNSNACRVGEK